jgi:hypothetical protein
MTAPRNFIEDFPSRCVDLLDALLVKATAEDREVTLMLCVAALSIATPLERLELIGKQGDHPSGDRQRFADAYCILNARLDGTVGDSGWWPQNGLLFGDIDLKSGEPVEWMRRLPQLDPKTILKDVLSVIRHSLAHGNIFVNPTQGQIERILLVNKPNDPQKTTRGVCMAPSGMLQLLGQWRHFLEADHLAGVFGTMALQSASAA